LYSPGDEPDGDLLKESAVSSFQQQQKPYQYKPLPTEMIAQPERNEDTNAPFLMVDDVTLKQGLVTESGNQGE
jgi:hypothetical protein